MSDPRTWKFEAVKGGVLCCTCDNHGKDSCRFLWMDSEEIVNLLKLLQRAAQEKEQ